jgi:hypothetical protein
VLDPAQHHPVAVRGGEDVVHVQAKRREAAVGLRYTSQDLLPAPARPVQRPVLSGVRAVQRSQRLPIVDRVRGQQAFSKVCHQIPPDTFQG